MTCKIEVRDAGGKGLGVFATAPIAAGELLCADPVVVMPRACLTHLDATPLRAYWWDWGDQIAVVLGLGSLMNDDPAPNAANRIGTGRSMEYVALRPIAAGEEITLDYRRTSR